jgi:hypothetical protein
MLEHTNDPRIVMPLWTWSKENTAANSIGEEEKHLLGENYHNTSGKISLHITEIPQIGNVDCSSSKSEIEPAIIVDFPGFRFDTNAGKEFQSFSAEVAAVVLDGYMKGVYLGSIRWGFKYTPDTKKIPTSATLDPKRIELVSAGTPSKEFMRAGLDWNRIMPLTDESGTYELIQVPISRERFKSDWDDLDGNLAGIAEDPEKLIDSSMSDEELINELSKFFKCCTNPKEIRENLEFKNLIMLRELTKREKITERMNNIDKKHSPSEAKVSETAQKLTAEEEQLRSLFYNLDVLQYVLAIIEDSRTLMQLDEIRFLIKKGIGTKDDVHKLRDSLALIYTNNKSKLKGLKIKEIFCALEFKNAVTLDLFGDLICDMVSEFFPAELKKYKDESHKKELNRSDWLYILDKIPPAMISEKIFYYFISPFLR